MDKCMGEIGAADKEYYVKIYDLKDGEWTVNEIIAYLQTIVPAGDNITVTINHCARPLEKFQLSRNVLHTNGECTIWLRDDVDYLRVVYLKDNGRICDSAEIFMGGAKEVEG